jgi:hypothetical protein
MFDEAFETNFSALEEFSAFIPLDPFASKLWIIASALFRDHTWIVWPSLPYLKYFRQNGAFSSSCSLCSASSAILFPVILISRLAHDLIPSLVTCAISLFIVQRRSLLNGPIHTVGSLK